MRSGCLLYPFSLLPPPSSSSHRAEELWKQFPVESCHTRARTRRAVQYRSWKVNQDRYSLCCGSSHFSFSRLLRQQLSLLKLLQSRLSEWTSLSPPFVDSREREEYSTRTQRILHMTTIRIRRYRRRRESNGLCLGSGVLIRRFQQ